MFWKMNVDKTNEMSNLSFCWSILSTTLQAKISQLILSKEGSTAYDSFLFNWWLILSLLHWFLSWTPVLSISYTYTNNSRIKKYWNVKLNYYFCPLQKGVDYSICWKLTCFILYRWVLLVVVSSFCKLSQIWISSKFIGQVHTSPNIIRILYTVFFNLV